MLIPLGGLGNSTAHNLSLGAIPRDSLTHPYFIQGQQAGDQLSMASGKEGAKDPPDWAKAYRPKGGESGKEFAKRLMDEKYGPGKYKVGAGSEFNKIKKWADRSFE